MSSLPQPGVARSGRRLALVFGALIFATGLSEVTLRVVYRIAHGCWLGSDSFKVPYVRPISDRRVFSLAPGHINTELGITIDDRGFRILCPPAERDDPVIVCLGDSVPFGVGVRDGESYPAQLARRLEKTELRVLNGGVPSYNLRQSIDRFELDVAPRFRNVRAITLQAANDVSLLSYYRDEWSPDRTWADVAFEIPVAARGLAITHYLLRARTAAVRHDADPFVVWPVQRMIDDVHANLGAFLARCEERHAQVVLLPVDPFYYQTKNLDRNAALGRWKEMGRYEKCWHAMIDALDGQLAAIAHEHQGAVFLDTRPILDDQDREKMFVDFLHLTPAGNELVARAIFETLQSRGVVR